MAVLRSKRHWIVRIPASVRSEVTPNFGDSGVTPSAAPQVVFIAPAGYRAIIRTVTVVLEQTPATGEPAAYVYARHVGGILTPFHWHWFVSHITGVAEWRLASTWNGQLVLEAGEEIAVWNGSPVILSTTGSGALLPLPST